ncbi:MAG: hypothetical protein R2941_02260 [Desulfobacterales bacterium]
MKKNSQIFQQFFHYTDSSFGLIQYYEIPSVQKPLRLILHLPDHSVTVSIKRPPAESRWNYCLGGLNRRLKDNACLKDGGFKPQVKRFWRAKANFRSNKILEEKKTALKSSPFIKPAIKHHTTISYYNYFKLLKYFMFTFGIKNCRINNS